MTVDPHARQSCPQGLETGRSHSSLEPSPSTYLFLPVFLSRFRLLWNLTSCADSGGDTEEPSPTRTPSGSVHSSEGPTLSGQDGAGTQLDEDGDLDVVRRPRTASGPDSTGLLRDKVHPTILRQEEDAIGAEEAYGSSPLSLIQIGKLRQQLCECWKTGKFLPQDRPVFYQA